MSNFQDDDHALRTGMFLGSLMKAGIMVIPEIDDEQNYTPDITVVFPGDRNVDEFSVHVRVLPGPPEAV
jgi:hypothetical protein